MRLEGITELIDGLDFDIESPSSTTNCNYDYIEIFGHVGGSSGTYFGGGSSVYESLFGAYKIIE